MPRFYCLMLADDGTVVVLNAGSPAPDEEEPVPHRPSDFPVSQVPFAEEARLAVLERLYGGWVAQKGMPVMVRVDERGAVTAWLAIPDRKIEGPITGERYFVYHAGGSNPDNDEGMMGRVYVWRGEWIRSPQEVAHNERDPLMKLRPLWGPKVDVAGPTGCFTEVTFEEPPDPYF